MTDIQEEIALNLDLGEAHQITGIQLHAIETNQYVPQLFKIGMGIPSRFLIEGSLSEDFSDAALLLDHHQNKNPLKVSSPILSWNIPPTNCRYIRLLAKGDPLRSQANRIGFAEIELLSKTANVAKGIPVTSPNALETNFRRLSTLTDGRNLYGNILPTRTWLEQLARRHDLEKQLPRLEKEIALHHKNQTFYLGLMVLLAALLATGIGIVIFIGKNRRRQQLAQLKQRVAADLHDELGANLHTIRLLGELANESKEYPSEIARVLQRQSKFTDRSISSVKNFSSLFEGEGLKHNLSEELKRASNRFLFGIRHKLKIQGEELLNRLKDENDDRSSESGV